jgi:hypothetical protein
MTRKEVKKFYSHNLVNSYSDLDAKHKNLDSGEVALLTEANNIYSVKKFEYLNTYDAANAYKRFPNLNTLTALARKIANYYI